jgi:hypothetical protein
MILTAGYHPMAVRTKTFFGGEKTGPFASSRSIMFFVIAAIPGLLPMPFAEHQLVEATLITVLL